MKRRRGRLFAATLCLALACGSATSPAQPRAAVWMESQSHGKSLTMAARGGLAVRIGRSNTHTLELLRNYEVLMDQGYGVAASPLFRSTWAIVATSQGKMLCTAVAVGPATLLTAAHCVGNGEILRATGDSMAQVDLICRWHADFKASHSTDAQLKAVKGCKVDAVCSEAQDLAWCSGPLGSTLPAGSPATLPADGRMAGAMQLIGARGCEVEPPLEPWTADAIASPLEVNATWAPLQWHWTPYKSKRNGTSASPTCPGDSGAPIIDKTGQVVGIHLAETDGTVAWAIELTKKTLTRALKAPPGTEATAGHKPTVCGVNDGSVRPLAFKPACE